MLRSTLAYSCEIWTTKSVTERRPLKIKYGEGYAVRYLMIGRASGEKNSTKNNRKKLKRQQSIIS